MVATLDRSSNGVIGVFIIFTRVLYCRWLCSPPPLDSRILYTVIHVTGSLIMNTGYRESDEVSSMAGKWSDFI